MSLNFSATIREARKARGLTQQQLAQQLGVKNTTISNWEKSLSKPGPDMIDQLCRVLGIQPGALFGQEESEELGFDDFTYALYNETQELTQENKEKLLEMARFFKHQQEAGR